MVNERTLRRRGSNRVLRMLLLRWRVHRGLFGTQHQNNRALERLGLGAIGSRSRRCSKREKEVKCRVTGSSLSKMLRFMIASW